MKENFTNNSENGHTNNQMQMRQKIFWSKRWQRKEHKRKMKWINNKEKELQGLEEATKVDIYLYSLRAILEKYRMGKRQVMTVYMESGLNDSRLSTTTWCNAYRRRIWTRRHEFKSWTRLIAYHIALIPLGKVWIQLFSLQLWVNSRAD